ncbi:MAG: chorismate synthase [Clostridia bacterium]|nr:chorismate synthase [Clostridia bacterium]
MLRFLTAGESHGPQLTVILEGMPSGIKIDRESINQWLADRQKGYGRGGRMAIERDQVSILSGIRGGYTLGSPITMVIENKDWTNWRELMTAEDTAVLSKRKVTRPRPGHVDLAGAIKYRHQDMRNVLERASARETAARVAVGALVWQFLNLLNIEVLAHVISLGPVKCPSQEMDWEVVQEQIRRSSVCCADDEASAAMVKAIDRAREAGETLGGVFEIMVRGLPPGLGSYVHWDRRLDGLLAQALMSIQGIKGVEIGLGFRAGFLSGSQVHDPIYYGAQEGFYRPTNGAGGLEGGVTNGEILVLRAAMKPIPTLMKPLASVDVITKEPVEATKERSDVCAVPAATVVGKAVIAPVLANALLEKFGHDNIDEIKKAWQDYWDYVRDF